MQIGITMDICAIIPARGGSKGIPRKNIRLVAGKPLLAYSIEQAKASTLVTRVIVSTDDAEIGSIAQSWGAEVVFRPALISGDRASSESALLHTLETLEATEHYVPELVVFLQCTSPLTVAEDIDGTVKTMLAEGADTGTTVVPFHYFLWCRQKSGDAVGINHDKRIRPMRQDREPQYLETGAVYVMRTAGFRAARHRFFGITSLYEMPPERHLEIDDPFDLVLAEMLLHKQHQHACIKQLPEGIAALVLDFDGVFTDNRVLVLDNAQEGAFCNRSDGLGLAELKRRTKLSILVLSTEKNPIVAQRCRKLDLECMHGVADKAAALIDWLAGKSIGLSHTVYVGNDVNDLPCLQIVGCGVVVADAHPTVKAAARMVLSSGGGHGAIRELTDLLIKKNGVL